MVVDGQAEAASVSSRDQTAPYHHTRRVLGYTKGHLQRSALRLAIYLLAAYSVLKLIPSLEQALTNLEHVSWPWGSLPLPAGIGTIGGIIGVLILYGVNHDAAVAAVLYQAIGLVVPLVGGGIAYAILRRDLGRAPTQAGDGSPA